VVAHANAQKRIRPAGGFLLRAVISFITSEAPPQTELESLCGKEAGGLVEAGVSVSLNVRCADETIDAL
jgi:hypothetical protein